MGFYNDQILPRLVDWGMRGGEFKRLREKYLSGLRGTVLEVGFGSGHNLPYYPQAVDKLFAIDPATVGRRLGKDRIAKADMPIEFVDLCGEEYQLDNDSVDAVVSTWTLCTIPNVGKAMNEIERVLKHGGKLHFLEHGLSPEATVAAWQNRLNPFQKFIAGGCHLNRPIDDIVAAGGLTIESLENFYMKGPKVAAYMYCGIASKKEEDV